MEIIPENQRKSFMLIQNVQSLEILDSRGNPTVRTIITLEDGTTHASSVPSGASTGSHEAVKIRDGDNTRYMGKGVLKAVENVNTTIKSAIVGMDTDPNSIDTKMLALDGTPNKENLGANAILSVSQAVVKAAAHTENKPPWEFMYKYYFSNTTRHSGEQSDSRAENGSWTSQDDYLGKPSFPQLLVNIVNGGRHANWNFDIQEFMIVPNTTKPSEAIRIAAEIFHSLGKVLKEKGLSTLVGDEGGYSPKLNSNEEVLDIIIEAAKLAGYENIKDFRLSLDCAATEWYKDGQYYSHQQNKTRTTNDLLSYYQQLAINYQLLSIEDAFAEDDWDAWKRFTEQNTSNHERSVEYPPVILGSRTTPESIIDPGQARLAEALSKRARMTIIGDDLLVTNPERIKRAIEEKSANAVLVKVNQIGTIKETVEAINMAHTAGWKTAISHRSGETEDSFIADLAYACGSEFIKTGSMSRSERLSKYNRLLEIEAGM